MALRRIDAETLLTENGWNKRKAFEDAKAFIRQTYPEPFYWAGFIMLD